MPTSENGKWSIAYLFSWVLNKIIFVSVYFFRYSAEKHRVNFSDVNHAWSYIWTAGSYAPYFFFTIYEYISWWLPWSHAIDITEHFAFSSNIIDRRHFEVMCLIFLMHGLWSDVYCLWIGSNFSWNHTQQQVQ